MASPRAGLEREGAYLMEITRLGEKDHFYFYHGDECLSINLGAKIYKLVTLRKESSEVPATPQEFLEVAKKYKFTLDLLDDLGVY